MTASRRTRRAVDVALRDALRHTTLGAACATAVQSALCARATATSAAHWRALQWFTVVALYSPAAHDMAAAVPAMQHCCDALLLSALATLQHHRTRHSTNADTTTTSNNSSSIPPLALDEPRAVLHRLDALAAALRSPSRAAAAAAWLARALSCDATAPDAATRHAASWRVALRCAALPDANVVAVTALCGWYTAAIVGARAELPPAAHAAWQPLLARYPPPLVAALAAEWARMLRRSPETATHNLACALAAMQQQQQQQQPHHPAKNGGGKEAGPTSGGAAGLVDAIVAAALPDVAAALSSARVSVRDASVRACAALAAPGTGTSASSHAVRVKTVLACVLARLGPGGAGASAEARLGPAMAARALAVAALTGFHDGDRALYYAAGEGGDDDIETALTAGPGSAALALILLPALTAALTAEPQPDVRAVLASAVAATLARTDSSTDSAAAAPAAKSVESGKSNAVVTAPLMEALLAGARDETRPQPLRMQCVAAVAAAAARFGGAPNSLACLDAAVAALLKLASAALATPGAHATVLPLMLPALILARNFPATHLDVLTRLPLWSAHILNAESALHSVAVYGRASSVTRTLALHAQLLCAQCSVTVRNYATVDAPVLRAHCALASSAAVSVWQRRAAVNAVRAVAAAQPALAAAAVRCAVTRRTQPVNADARLTLLPFVATAAAATTKTSAPTGATASTGDDSAQWRRRALPVVAAWVTAALSDDELALLCLALHACTASAFADNDDYVDDGGSGDDCDAHAAWAVALRRARADGSVPVAALAQLLLSRDALLADTADTTDAGQGNRLNAAAGAAALRALCVSFPASAIPPLAHRAAALWRATVAPLSARDVRVYRTPAGQLYEEPELEAYVPLESEGRRRGQNADAEWAEQVRREIAAKKNINNNNNSSSSAGDAKDSKRSRAVAEARERALAAEAAVRARVAGVHRVARGVLRALLAMATRSARQGDGNDDVEKKEKKKSGVLVAALPVLYAVAAEGLASPLEGSRAARAALALARAEPQLRAQNKAKSAEGGINDGVRDGGDGASWIVSATQRLMRLNADVRAGGEKGEEDADADADVDGNGSDGAALAHWAAAVALRRAAALAPSPAVAAVAYPLVAAYVGAKQINHDKNGSVVVDEIDSVAVGVLMRHASLSGPLPRGAMAATLLALMSPDSENSTAASGDDVHSLAIAQLGARFAVADAALLARHYDALAPVNARVALLRALTAAAPQRWADGDTVVSSSSSSSSNDEADLVGAVTATAYVARHERDAQVAAAAAQLWQRAAFALPVAPANLEAAYFGALAAHLGAPVAAVSEGAANALGAAAAEQPATLDAAIAALIALYNSPLSSSSSSSPSNGSDSTVAQSAGDAVVRVRCGVAVALSRVCALAGYAQLQRVLQWLLAGGGALADGDERVRTAFTDAGAAIVRSAPQHGDALYDMLSRQLAMAAASSADANSGGGGDGDDGVPVQRQMSVAEQERARAAQYVRLSCVIFVAALAVHMPAGDARLRDIISALLDAQVNTPSEALQRSISQHLAPLMGVASEDDVPALVTRLLRIVETSKERHERRGAAWGIAALVKGRKLPALKKFDILKGIERLLKDKKKAYAREGALNVIECLVVTLGQGFEAYYIFLLQQLLDRYGDGSVEVRNAAEVCAKQIMSSLSASGVRLVLGPLLKSLAGSDWRRKRGGVELLGSMAFISPAQLSSCLPSIVPTLTQVLSDTHVKVQEAAREALQNIGGVISNPEIKQHVPLVLQSFNDPDRYTEPLLRALLNTHFVHIIDAPSLALLMPAVSRALAFRTHEAKLMAAQIVGNIGSLTKPADLAPYLASLAEELRNLLIDASPEVRVVAARAWGNLLRGMGEAKFPDLVAWLLDNFETSTNHSTRAGSAQGLGEVLASVPQERFDVLMAEVLERTDHVAAGVRTGAMLTVAYLPTSPTGGERVQRLLPRVMDLLMRGLADDADDVRAAAMEAGRAMMARFARTELDLMVPKFEAGVFAAAWRTRAGSLQLLGEMFHALVDTSAGRAAAAAAAAATGNEYDPEDQSGGGVSADAAMSATSQEEALVAVLGMDRFDRLLAALFLIRCDANATVKQHALLVWKGVVHNPPRTIKRVMPVLMTMIISCLGSATADLRETAGRTLGELVERLSDKVIPTVLPALQQSASASAMAARQGTCLGLMHLVRASNKMQLLPFQDALTDIVATGLLDMDDAVREAAADAFSALVQTCGKRLLEDALTRVLRSAAAAESKSGKTDSSAGEAERAQDALRRAAALIPDRVVPYVVPELLRAATDSPSGALPLWAIRCLSAIAPCSGAYFARQLSTVLPTFASAVVAGQQQGADEATRATGAMASDASLAIACSIPEDGLYILVDQLCELLQSGGGGGAVDTVVFACTLIGRYVKHAAERGPDLDEFRVRFLDALLKLYVDTRAPVLDAACATMALVVDSIPPSEEERYVVGLRAALQSLRFEQIKSGGVPGNVPGLSKTVGILPIVKVFRQGVMLGSSAEVRELAATAISDVLGLARAADLQSGVVLALAPIIRVLSEKVPAPVKRAVLMTLNVLLELAAPLLRGFVPQLQTVFSRALQDVDGSVRDQAALAMGRLTGLIAQLDPLVNELCSGVQSAPSKVRHALLSAVTGAMTHAGGKISDKGMERILATLSHLRADASCNADERTRELTAKAFGAYAAVVPAVALDALMAAAVRGCASTEENVRDVNFQILSAVPAALRYGVALDQHSDAVLPLLAASVKDNSFIVRRSVVRALCEWLTVNVRSCPDNVPEIVRTCVAALQPEDRETRTEMLRLLKRFFRAHPSAASLEVLGVLVPPAVERALDKKSFPVKLAAERLLMTLLRVKSDKQFVAAYLKSIVREEERKELQNYVVKVLLKLEVDSSDDE